MIKMKTKIVDRVMIGRTVSGNRINFRNCKINRVMIPIWRPLTANRCIVPVSEFLNHSAWLIISAMNDLLMIVQKLPFPALEKQSNEEFPSDWIQVAFWCLLIFSYHMNSKKHLSGLLIPVIILLVSILIIAQNA
mgnify:CR=1 FL=1